MRPQPKPGARRARPGPRALVRAGVVLGVLALLPAAAANAAYVRTTPNAAPSIWQPGGIQPTVTVPVKPGAPAGKPAGRAPAAAAKPAPYRVPEVTWPSGTAQVTLAPASAVGAGQARTVRAGLVRQAGSLPVALAGDDASGAAARTASVAFASRQAAAAAGINGVLFTAARADGAAAASPTRLTLDYAAFSGAFGGGYADRLKLVELPACALTTPQVARCRAQTNVAFSEDQSTGTLTATVDLAAAAASPGTATSAAVRDGAMVFAATSTASGSVGSYTATSLNQAGSWTAGASTGAFTYSYPVKLPAAPGGATPAVALSYDSASVDGRTSATNAQASWIGDGWDYTPGYIERSYQPCSQDGITGAGDECWAGNIVTLSLNGQSESLVRDDASPNAWHLQDDDGVEVLPLTGQANGAYAGEAWEVIEPDGTQYYFGAAPDSLGAAPAADSTWTVPVYCPKSGDGPAGHSCYSSSTGTNSFAANLAWRWNLDYVVDPHGNLITYTWTPETNYYDRGYAQGGDAGTNALYTRGGYLAQIAYGYRVPDAVAGTKPTDTVTFSVAERCTPLASGFTESDCTYAYLTSHLTSTSATENWPDVPADQICVSASATCSNYTPSFFTTKSLAVIATAVLVGSAYQPADSYALSQYFPSPQAGLVVDPTKSYDSPGDPGDGTVAVMWLESIQHTGEDTLGGGTAVTEPATVFTPDLMPNRVDGTTTGYAALYRPRMDSITTPSGEQIVVSYSTPQCSSTDHPTPDANTENCFPQYWSPPGSDGTPILDWFNTYQVTEVTQNDLVAPPAWSEAEITQYAYQSAAWARDESPLTPNAQRTWNQFHGFQTVTTTVGAASAESVPTQTVSIYMQGMNGDYLADGSQRSVCVKDNVGDCVTDAPELQGQVLETDTLDGVAGAVEKRTVNGPWTYTQTASQAQTSQGSPATPLPALTAQVQTSSRVRTYALWHDGSWKILTTVDAYDADGRLTTSDAQGDGTSAVPEVCTTTSYATSTSTNPNMLGYPDQVEAVQGPCGTAANAQSAVSDKLTYYDGSSTLGALTGAGDATETRQAVSFSAGGVATYATMSESGYDAYGRVTSTTGPDGATTTTSYTAPGATPDVVTTTNPMGWTTSVTLEPGHGSTLASTDVNGELTSYTYDGLGEVTAAWSPLHAKASGAPADDTFAYRETGTSPSTVSTSKLLDDGQYATTVDLYDGDLRAIQVQAPTLNGAGGRLDTNTHYNSLGQQAKASAPFSPTGTADPGTTVDVPVDDTYVPNQSETAYDGMGRVVKAETVAFGVDQYATSTAYVGTDQTDVTPLAGGTATSTFTDALGRTTATWTYTKPAPTDKAADAVATTYTFTPAGQQATITDSAGNEWTFTYNLLGQKTSISDPGAGTSSTVYSPGGETLSTTDADGTTLTYTYDLMGRKKAEYDTTGGIAAGPTDELAAWTYDTLAKGQPTSTTTYTNPAEGADDPANTYTETQLGYTALYQSTGASVTIPSSQGPLAGTYQSTDLYTSGISLLSSIRYGADGGLPREAVNLGYNTAGELDGYSGTTSYLNLATYDVLGQVQQTNFGPSGSQMDRTETYDAATGRLITQSDQLQTLSSTLDDTTYTYDQAGALTAESDTQYGVSSPDTQCFDYTGLGELSAAFTSTDAVTATPGLPSSQIQGIGGCDDTAPVAGKVTGGPAPYWQTYAYDTLGDRVQEVDHDTSVTSSANTTTQTLSYNGYDAATGVSTAAATPDAVQQVSGTGPAGTTTSSYTYYPNGAVQTRAGQSFTYTPSGQTATVTNTATNTTTSYTYDAAGDLLVQADPADDQTILYLPWGEQLTDDTGNGVVTGQRFYAQSPDGLVVVRSGDGTLSYEADNTQGTATLEVNAATQAYAFRYYDPYGAARGTAPTSWPDQHAYLGKPQDPSTGLDLLGAREYDPATGRFLAVDPLLETGDQRQMNGYSYSGDDPVNGTDPTGQMMGCFESGTGCVIHGVNPGQNTPQPPTCSGGQHMHNGSCVDDLVTITVHTYNGGELTYVADADKQAFFAGHQLTAATLKSFYDMGYQGSAALTESDLLEWAMGYGRNAEAGWAELTASMGIPIRYAQADPFTGNKNIYDTTRPMLQSMALMASVGALATCAVTAGAGCVVAGLTSIAVNAASERANGANWGTVAANATLESAIFGAGRLMDYGYGLAEKTFEEAFVNGEGAEAAEALFLTEGALPAVKLASTIPESAYTGISVYGLMSNDDRDVDFPTVGYYASAATWSNTLSDVAGD